MKYPQLVSMPTAIYDWLEEQLEARGIDAVVYTRYVLSILYRDPLDLICSEQELQFCQPNKEIKRSTSGRKRFRRSSDWWAYDISNADKLKRSAAVECLMSASDQECGFESLVDELCEKLKEVNNGTVTVTSEEISPIEKKSTQKKRPRSPEDPAKLYYAAFPPLSRNSSANSPNLINLIPKWLGSPKKRASRKSNRTTNNFEEKLHRKVDTDILKATARGNQKSCYYLKTKDIKNLKNMSVGLDTYAWNMRHWEAEVRAMLEEGTPKEPMFPFLNWFENEPIGWYKPDLSYEDFAAPLLEDAKEEREEEAFIDDSDELANRRLDWNFQQLEETITNNLLISPTPPKNGRDAYADLLDGIACKEKYNNSVAKYKTRSFSPPAYSMDLLSGFSNSYHYFQFPQMKVNPRVHYANPTMPKYWCGGTLPKTTWSNPTYSELKQRLAAINHSNDSMFTEVLPGSLSPLEVQYPIMPVTRPKFKDHRLTKKDMFFTPIDNPRRDKYEDGMSFKINSSMDNVKYRQSFCGNYFFVEEGPLKGKCYREYEADKSERTDTFVPKYLVKDGERVDQSLEPIEYDSDSFYSEINFSTDEESSVGPEYRESDIPRACENGLSPETDAICRSFWDTESLEDFACDMFGVDISQLHETRIDFWRQTINPSSTKTSENGNEKHATSDKQSSFTISGANQYCLWGDAIHSNSTSDENDNYVLPVSALQQTVWGENVDKRELNNTDTENWNGDHTMSDLKEDLAEDAKEIFRHLNMLQDMVVEDESVLDSDHIFLKNENYSYEKIGVVELADPRKIKGVAFRRVSNMTKKPCVLDMPTVPKAWMNQAPRLY